MRYAQYVQAPRKARSLYPACSPFENCPLESPPSLAKEIGRWVGAFDPSHLRHRVVAAAKGEGPRTQGAKGGGGGVSE